MFDHERSERPESTRPGLARGRPDILMYSCHAYAATVLSFSLVCLFIHLHPLTNRTLPGY